MIEFGMEPKPGLVKALGSSAMIKVGKLFTGTVAGPTRHGLALNVEQQAFVLKPSSKLPDAKTLTLEFRQAAPNGGFDVKVVAADDRPLEQPVSGRLASRSHAEPARPPTNTLVLDHAVEVSAQPLSSDGKAVGASVLVRLAARTGTDSHGIAKSPLVPNPSPTAQAGPLVPSQPLGQPSPDHSAAARGHAASGVAAIVHESGQETPSADPARHDPRRANRAITNPVMNQRPLSPANRGKALPVDRSPPVDRSSTTTSMPAPATATVVGRSPAGELMIATADRQLSIKQPIDLPIGAELHVTYVTSSSGAFGATNAETVSHRTNPLTVLIELLEDIDRASRQPGNAEASIRDQPRQLPMPDRNLASRLLGLLNVKPEFDVAGGGQSARDGGLDATTTRDRLHTAVADLTRATSDALADEWQGLKLPVGPDSAHAVCILHRDHELDSDGEAVDASVEPSEIQRAVFEIDFSRLGRCQIDALCQQDRFDLLVRSERSLESPLQQEIADLYMSACQIAGLKGDIGFRVGQFFEPPKASTTMQAVTT